MSRLFCLKVFRERKFTAGLDKLNRIFFSKSNSIKKIFTFWFRCETKTDCLYKFDMFKVCAESAFYNLREGCFWIFKILKESPAAIEKNYSVY